MAEKKESGISPLPFLNTEFMKSPPARTIRILSEYLEPAERLRRAHIRDTIVFFGSARSPSPEQAAQQLAQVTEEIVRVGAPSAELAEARTRAETGVRLARYYQDAVELSRRLTEWSKSLTGNRDFIICSGGSGGMMEAANRGASLAGGKTIGLNIQLPQEQCVNSYVPRELVFNFHYFFMRKFWFVYLAKALVIFLTEPQSNLVPASTTSLKLQVKRNESGSLHVAVARSRISREGIEMEVNLHE